MLKRIFRQLNKMNHQAKEGVLRAPFISSTYHGKNVQRQLTLPARLYTL